MWSWTYCPRDPAKTVRPAAPSGWTGSHGCEWSPGSGAEHLVPSWQSCGLCLSVSVWEPFAWVFPFLRVCSLSHDSWWKQVRALYNKGMAPEGCRSHSVSITCYASPNFTSRKSSYLWEAQIERTTQLGKTLTEKSYFFITHTKINPHFSLEVVQRLVDFWNWSLLVKRSIQDTILTLAELNQF